MQLPTAGLLQQGKEPQLRLRLLLLGMLLLLLLPKLFLLQLRPGKQCMHIQYLNNRTAKCGSMQG